MGVNVMQMGGGGKKIAESTATTVTDVPASNAISAKGITKGSYDEQSKILLPYEDVANAIGLTADKIVGGNSVLGIAGTGGITEKSIELTASKYTTYITIESMVVIDKKNGLISNIDKNVNMYDGGKTTFLKNIYAITGLTYNGVKTSFLVPLLDVYQYYEISIGSDSLYFYLVKSSDGGTLHYYTNSGNYTFTLHYLEKEE